MGDFGSIGAPAGGAEAGLDLVGLVFAGGAGVTLDLVGAAVGGAGAVLGLVGMIADVIEAALDAAARSWLAGVK